MMRLVALGSTSTLAWRFLGSTRQAEKHHGGLGVIKSKVSLRAGEGRKHDFFHAQNDGNDHVSTDWAAVLWARFLSLFDCQTAADSCEVGIGTIYVYIYICVPSIKENSILYFDTGVENYTYLFFLNNAMFHGYYIAIMLL